MMKKAIKVNNIKNDNKKTSDRDFIKTPNSKW